jgi:hypothetical protein
MLWSTWLSILDNLFCSDLSIVVSFLCVSLGWCRPLFLGVYVVGWRLQHKGLDERMDGRDNNPHGILTERFLGQVTNQTTFILEPSFTTKLFYGQEGWY